jgi:hypothetical protein
MHGIRVLSRCYDTYAPGVINLREFPSADLCDTGPSQCETDQSVSGGSGGRVSFRKNDAGTVVGIRNFLGGSRKS